MTDTRNVSFVKNMKELLIDKFYDSSYSNLLGFTIHNDYIQFKNYYELKEVPTEKQLLNFLPEAESFIRESKMWDSTLKSSLAIGLKIDNTSTTQYFHVKFGKNSNNIIHKKHIPFLSILGEKNILCGVSYEYTTDKVLQKNYIYIINKSDIKKLLIMKGIEEDVDKLEQLECYYTDEDFKINLVYDKPTDARIEPIINKLDEKTILQYKNVLSVLNNYNKSIWYFGVTKNKKLSIYFTITRDKDFLINL